MGSGSWSFRDVGSQAGAWEPGEYQVWEEGSHPQLIDNETVMGQKLDYIHRNPVERGYVDLPEHWRYSSARNYAGLEGLIEVVRDW